MKSYSEIISDEVNYYTNGRCYSANFEVLNYKKWSEEPYEGHGKTIEYISFNLNLSDFKVFIDGDEVQDEISDEIKAQMESEVEKYVSESDLEW